MKTTTFILLLFLSIGLFGQKKSELGTQIVNLETRVILLEKDVEKTRQENKILQQEIISLKDQISHMSLLLSQKEKGTSTIEGESVTPNTSTEKKQCKAKTASGKQCSRDAQEGSDYCWQHRPTYEPSSTKEEDSGTGTKPNSSVGSSKREIHTGPRGGKYYINANGKKTYIKK